MIPLCDQTGVPLHFHSSTTSGSASLIRARSRESISPLQSPRCSILASISADGDSAPFDLLFVMLSACPWVSPSAEGDGHADEAVHECRAQRHDLASEREVRK